MDAAVPGLGELGGGCAGRRPCGGHLRRGLGLAGVAGESPELPRSAHCGGRQGESRGLVVGGGGGGGWR